MSKSVILTDKKRTLIFVNIIITCVASSLLQTALTTAMPPIAEDFNVSVTTGQWLTSAYSLVMAIMMPLTAFLIRRIPSKKLYIWTIIIFLAGSGICIIAPSFPVLMMGRVLQACSNGISGAMAQVLLLSMYPPERSGTIMGWYGLSVGAAPVIAPTLAGILVDHLGWRMIFVFAFVIMVISLIYAIMVMEDVLETSVMKFDMVSFLLSALTFGGITLGIGNVSNGITEPGVYIPLVIGIVSGCIFIYRQLHIAQPFLELRICKHYEFAFGVLGSMMLYFIMMGTSMLLPLYVQNLLGRSPTISGLVALPGSLVMAIISPLAGKIYDRVGMKKLAVTGAIALLVGAVGMSLVSAETSLIVAVLLNMIRSVAIGCLLMPFVTWGLGGLDRNHTADGTALLNSLRTIAGAIGTAVAVGIMSTVAEKSADTYGSGAGMHGMHVSFAVMSIAAVIMLIISIVFMKPGPKKFVVNEM